MMHIDEPFVARNGSWCELQHPVAITEDDPRYAIAHKIFGSPSRIAVMAYWQVRDDEWVAFVEECNPHILEGE